MIPQRYTISSVQMCLFQKFMVVLKIWQKCVLCTSTETQLCCQQSCQQNHNMASTDAAPSACAWYMHSKSTAWRWLKCMSTTRDLVCTCRSWGRHKPSYLNAGMVCRDVAISLLVCHVCGAYVMPALFSSVLNYFPATHSDTSSSETRRSCSFPARRQTAHISQ